MKLFGVSFIVLFSVVASMHAQQNKEFSSGVERKIARSEKNIAKGDAIVAKADKYTQKIDEINEKGTKRRGKLKRLQNKSNKIIITSASIYKEGYGKKYKTYKKFVAKGIETGALQQDAVGLMEDAKVDYKVGRKLRRRSSNALAVKQGASLLVEANEYEALAIESLMKAAGKYSQIEIESEAITDFVEDTSLETKVTQTADSFEWDSKSSQQIAEPAYAVAVTAMGGSLMEDAEEDLYENMIESSLYSDAMQSSGDSMATLEAIDEAVVETPFVQAPVEEARKMETVPVAAVKATPQVYFSVQFLAVKAALAKWKLKDFYDGQFEIVEHKSDGWYKYSFGKFTTVQEANSMKSRSGMQGFVVAFLNGQRVTIKEATDILEK